MPAIPVELEKLPSYMLLRCIDMRITTAELTKAINAISGYSLHGSIQKKLGVFLLLTAKMFPELTEVQYNRLLLATFNEKLPEGWPDFDELIAIGHSQARDLMSLKISKKEYLYARRLGLTHFEITNAARREKFVNIEGYAKLRKVYRINDDEIYTLIDRGINLYYYCELIKKAYHKSLYESVLEHFGTDLFAYLMVADDFGLEPEVIIERKTSAIGFNIAAYKELRNQGLDDMAAWQKLCNSSLQAANVVSI